MSDIEEKIIDIGHEIFKGYGVDDSTAQILSILNFESKEISMEELAQRTGASRESVTKVLKALFSQGLARESGTDFLLSAELCEGGGGK